MLAALVLHTWVSVSEVISNAATALALLIGGIWGYRRFFRERTRWPRADLALTVTQRHLDPQTVLVNVKIGIRNDGRGLMELTKVRVDLHHVLPLESEMREKIDVCSHPEDSRVEAAWPLIKRLKRIWEAERPELEPGESDAYGFDFFVPATTETAFLYAYVDNLAKKGGKRELGWSLTEYVDIDSPAPAGFWTSLWDKTTR
jgi:hypothetical protein